MNKTLKFAHHYISNIIKNKQGVTTRLFDEKDISAGDLVDFLDADSTEKFAIAKINKVEEKTFAEVMNDAADIPGMYEQYANYYKREVKPETQMKVIHFELVL